MSEDARVSLVYQYMGQDPKQVSEPPMVRYPDYTDLLQASDQIADALQMIEDYNNEIRITHTTA